MFKKQAKDVNKKAKAASVKPGSVEASNLLYSLQDDDEGADPKDQIKVKKPRFKNDAKFAKGIKMGKPIFKREQREDQARAGYTQLLSKLNDSELTIRRIKNGQTIFDQDSMRTKYANPYFRNEKMHKTFVDFIEAKKPKLTPNPNINQFEQDKLPVPEETNRS